MGVAPSLWMNAIETRSGPPVVRSIAQETQSSGTVARAEGGRR
jgi:hypothetical protein